MKDNRIIVDGHAESLSGKWGRPYRDDPRILYTYGSGRPSTGGDYNNVVFFEHFFWCEPSYEYFHNGTYKYKPNKTYKNTFLMPVRNHKGQAAWRGEVINSLRDKLDDAIYSIYVEDKFLPNSDRKSNHRQIEPSWFDDTFFSLTLESYCDPEKPIFKTEKIFKPIGFYHPMLVIGSPGTLKSLKDLGFETFDNLFDESYDSVTDINKKIKIIKKNIDRFNYEPYDNLTWDKLHHNHNLYFDQHKITQLLTEYLVEPVTSWIEDKK
jgi:hypothetical protein